MSSGPSLPDRLSTTDARGGRVYVYPADVRGRFRRWRSAVSGLLIAFFLLVPWIQWDGHQAVFFDAVNRQIHFFEWTFWSHDAPLIVFFLAGWAFLIAGVTAIWGRVWCGWACPQTVFVDGVYRRIERLVEGDAFTRRRRNQSGWGVERVTRGSLKWVLFIVVSLVITHSFLAYFVGGGEVLKMMGRSPFESPVSFMIVMGASALILFDFGWFREQFCTIVCPYGRFQSVLLDDRSKVIEYRSERGEPRRNGGDCVDCKRCVQVCPTGIDIRHGLQMECIGCTACIDACDEVMTRLSKPPGLIAYRSEKGMFRPRVVVFGLIFSGITAGLIAVLLNRAPIETTVLRPKGAAPYQELTDGSGLVLNHFRLDLVNQSRRTEQVEIRLDDTLVARGFAGVQAQGPVVLKPGEHRRVEWVVRFPSEALEMGRLTGRLVVTAGNWEKKAEVRFVGPFR